MRERREFTLTPEDWDEVELCTGALALCWDEQGHCEDRAAMADICRRTMATLKDVSARYGFDWGTMERGDPDAHTLWACPSGPEALA